MPIIDLQVRMRQLGEIRIGHSVPTGKTRRDGKPGTRPVKLDKFRFTSPSADLLEQVAKLYGGQVRPWTPANGGPDEFEVFSTTDRLPVLVPPRNSLTQWYELYQGSRCVRRCDGQTEQKSDQPCMCNAAKRQCSVTTRLNVMLRDVPALGVWLLTTHGYTAASELPASAELLAMTNGYVPGWLGMEEKTAMLDEGPARFMVPHLDVGISPAALLSGNVPGLAAAPARAALTAGEHAIAAGTTPDYVAQALAAGSFDGVRQVRNAAAAAGHLSQSLDGQLKQIADGKQAPPPAEQGDAPPPAASRGDAPGDEPEVVIPELVHPDTDEVWMQIVMAAGGLGWTTDRLEEEFAARNDGTFPGSADISELRAFLAALKSGAIK